jgi:hypothetical protein
VSAIPVVPQIADKRSHSHFGDSVGTFAHTQFFHEPSLETQADDEDGISALAAV